MTSDPDDNLLADLYVLGLLDPDAHSEADTRMEHDGTFAARVANAARRFAPLDDSAAPVPLPNGAWERLERRLSAPVEQPAARLPSSSVRRGSAANVNRAPWRTAMAMAAALVLMLGLAWPFLRASPFGSPAEAAAVAVLLDPKGVPFALIEDFGNGKAAVTTLASYEVPEGESLQVWTKWSEETGPVSLGVLNEFASAPLGTDGLPQPVAGQLYEITLEEEGGSPTGRPTGPILGVGLASIPG
jgi:anti-sigma-K factor RskA